MISPTPGLRLGPYELVSALGAGGMGEVWKARDTRVDRIVAIKFAHADFGERFEREARAIASLNHPNICQLYDVGPNYLVMEFVEGTPIQPTDDRRRLLDYATQIAGGLAAAHAAGVVHRDLKPDNILVTRDGRVKILDFGLAKQTAAPDLLASETRAVGVTKAGTIVGTIAYMSPEQARGQALDARSDQFSFGLILYELAGGRRAFDRPSSAETMAAIIRDDPEPLPAAVPGPLAWTIERCLAKDPALRYESTGDLYHELRTLRERLTSTSDRSVATAAPRRTPAGAVTVAAAVCALAAGLVTGALWQKSRAREPVRVWTGTRLGGPRVSMSPRVSPDGQLLAFIALADGKTPELGVMKIGSESWTLLTHGSQDGYVQNVCWSRDGSKLYFDRYWGKPAGIYTIPPLGGEPVLLVDNAFEPQALADGSLLVLKQAGPHLQIVRFWPDSGRIHPFPAFVVNADVAAPISVFSDGREVAFFGRIGSPDSAAARAMYVMDVDSGRARKLDPQATLDDRSLLSLPLTASADGAHVITLAKRGDTYAVIELRRDGVAGHRVLFSLRPNELPWYMDAAPDGSIYLDQIDRPYSVVRVAVDGGTPELFPSPVVDAQQVLPLSDGRIVLSTVAGRSRVLIGQPGSELRPLLQGSEETSAPLATAGADAVGMTVGTGAQRRIAIASVTNGRILREFQAPAGEMKGLAVSPDRGTVYYGMDGSIYAQPASGLAKKIGEGDTVALDPTGRYLYAKQFAREPIRLVRIELASGRSEDVALPPAQRLTNIDLSPAAVDARGRIVLDTTSPLTWFYGAAVLDTNTGSMTPLHLPGFFDCMAPGWTADSKVICAGAGLTGSLWRYRAE